MRAHIYTLMSVHVAPFAARQRGLMQCAFRNPFSLLPPKISTHTAAVIANKAFEGVQ